MGTVNGFRRLARDVRDILREGLRRFAEALWDIQMAPHRPDDVMGDGSLAYCHRCRREWPCTEWTRLETERSAALGTEPRGNG